MSELPEVLLGVNGPTVAGASADLLRELLDKYEQELRSAGAPIDGMLAPGLRRAQIEDDLDKAGLVPNDEIVAWYEWHNGAEIDPQTDRLSVSLPGVQAAPLFLAVQNYRTLALSEEVRDEPDWGAGVGWLRLEDQSVGWALECTGVSSKPPLIHYANNEFSFPENSGLFRAESLCTAVTWWLMALRNGAFSWNSGASLWTVSPERLPDTQRATQMY